MHELARNARDILLAAVLLAEFSGLASGLASVILGRFLPSGLAGWAVLAAVIATVAAIAIMGIPDPPRDDSDITPVFDLMKVLSVGIQPFAFSFGLWIGRTLRRGAAQNALDE